MIPSASNLPQEKLFAFLFDVCFFICLWVLFGLGFLVLLDFFFFFLLVIFSTNKTNAYLDLMCMRNSQPCYCPEVI